MADVLMVLPTDARRPQLQSPTPHRCFAPWPTLCVLYESGGCTGVCGNPPQRKRSKVPLGRAFLRVRAQEAPVAQCLLSRCYLRDTPFCAAVVDFDGSILCLLMYSGEHFDRCARRDVLDVKI